MIIIKCAKCKEIIIKYVKLGKGNVHLCYKSRIQKYYVPLNNKELKCPNCGKVIGTDRGYYIKMNHHTFTYSGTIILILENYFNLESSLPSGRM